MYTNSYGSYMNSLLNDGSTGIDLISRVFASTVVGFQAQNGSPTYSNTIIGYQAGLTYTGNRTVAVGVGAIAYGGRGNDNIAIGTYAGCNVKSASRNVLVGSYAGASITGDDNIAIGFSNTSKAKTSLVQSVSLGSYTQTSGRNLVCIGASNTVTDASESIVVGTHNIDSGNQNIVIGKNVVNSGANCLILNTKHIVGGELFNANNNIINIQDRILGFDDPTAGYALKLVAESFIVQTANGDVDILAGGGGQGGGVPTIHHILGECSPIEDVYAGIGTTFTETLCATSNLIIEGQLLVMGGICYGGIMSPTHIFDGDVSLCNDLLVRGNATFCNNVKVIATKTSVDNCNLSYYIDKISQVATFFDTNVNCDDSVAVYAGVGVTFDDTLHAASNLVVDGQLHVKGGICFGGLHAVQEPIMRVAQLVTSGFPYVFAVNPLLQTVDVDIAGTATAGAITIVFSMAGQQVASFQWTQAAPCALYARAIIIKINDTSARAMVYTQMYPGEQLIQNTLVNNMNWSGAQQVSVTSTGAVTGNLFRLTVSS